MQDTQPTKDLFVEDWESEESYNPLEFIEGEDEEEIEEGIITDDSVLLPQALGNTNRPKRPSVYTPQSAGSAEAALTKLVQSNTHRRALLLNILDWAQDGIEAEELFAKIEEAQTYNKSVFDSMSYCRMLERAGGLVMNKVPKEDEAATPAPTVEGVEASEVAESIAPAVADETEAFGVRYLTIDEDFDRIWQTTPAGLEVLEALTQGTEWRERVFGEDIRYIHVYRALMEAMTESPRPLSELTAMAEAFEETKSPRKMGNYFIDNLESVSAASWADGLWGITDLGRSLLPELQAACASDAA